MKRRTVFPIVGLVLILAVIKIFLTAALATAGFDLDQTRKEAKRMEEQKLLLKEEIASLSTLSRISREAARLEFRKSERIVSLTLEVPLAMRESQ